MTPSESAASVRPLGALGTIFLAGMVAGILDGTDAAVFIGMIRGAGVMRVFQFIASGALGTRAFHGGWATAAIGCGFHFLIATGAAATYYGLSRTLPALTKRPGLYGPVFGLGVFFFMHYVVVPLSAAPQRSSFGLIDLLNQLFAHTLFVGFSIAWITSRSARRQPTNLASSAAS